MLGKLLVVAVLMFGFGYALVPMYRAICDALGINVLSCPSSAWRRAGRRKSSRPTRRSTPARTITVEFDANARGPWDFKPARALAAGASGRTGHRDVRVPQRAEPHDGRAGDPELRAEQARAHFNKLECFCFNEYTLAPGESKSGRWSSSSTPSCRRT
jgi:cytochrome c oxidase assembly protein subunit 11